MNSLAADEVKACCAASYGGEIATYLLGESFHPGGERLTRGLMAHLALRHDAVLVDVASGRGTSAMLAATETGCRVVGIDLSGDNVAHASAAARAGGLDGRVRFVCADAERLPLDDGEADAILCECALCLFPDKPRAVAELARVLRPGGCLALSDVVTEPARLSVAFDGLAGWASCVADARPVDQVRALLTDAGFEVTHTDRHDDAIAQLIDRVEARLRLARRVASTVPQIAAMAPRGLELVAAARAALADGALGYATIVARLPA